MNEIKAREFFSAYFEGTLDAGIRSKLEEALRSDANLAAEYRTFEETMDSLDAMRFEPIEAPQFLSDRIATRLEEERAARRRTTPPWFVLARNFSLAGIAAAAIFGTILSFNANSAEYQGGAVSSAQDQLTVRLSSGEVVLGYRPTGREVIEVATNGASERQLLDGQTLQSPLRNPNLDAAVFKVNVEGKQTLLHVVVPGTQRSTRRSGQGNLIEFSKAFADFYNVPVVLKAHQLEGMISWTFGTADAFGNATQALAARHYSVDQRPDGIITVSDN